MQTVLNRVSISHLTTMFVFIPSEGSVIDNSKDLVTDRVVQDWLRAEPMGYTQSKLVAERLVATTAATTGVKSVVRRIG
ncbi:hypothetical protein KCU73_g4487, partial [Aureobasidium melanogenum]